MGVQMKLLFNLCMKVDLIRKASTSLINHIPSFSVRRNFSITPIYQTKFSNKIRNKLLHQARIAIMSDDKIQEIIAPFQASVKEQGDIVRKLKTEKAPENDVKVAVTELKARKKRMEDKMLELTKELEGGTIDRTKLEDLLKQKFFYDMSFSIYGGVTGLYDFGPMGCAMKSNLLTAWRNFFVLEEQMLEVDCSMLTPETVLKASGHVERFSDYMVKDEKSGECFRADHLIEAAFEKMLADKKVSQEKKTEMKALLPLVESMGKDEMGSTITKYEIRSPVSGNPVSAPMEFNLMFHTSIGPAGHIKGFLRPETAQGIFVNFKRLLEFNQGKLPFAAAQIGNAFRNEISPRSGLIRVREFTMAEIEHFCDPVDKNHPKFSNVKDTVLNFYSASSQMDGELPKKMTIGQAVDQKLVVNETLAYFMARIHLFLTKVGVDPNKLRFRQHMSNEMAHYACDCWDAECKTSYGWVECVGCADRSCYDLQQHSKATGIKLVAEKKLAEPVEKSFVEVAAKKGIVGKTFKGDAKLVNETLSKLEGDAVNQFEADLSANGEHVLKADNKEFIIKSDMVEVKRYTKKVHVEEITPSVVEPSFGIGRVMYAIFEHNFKIREGDEQRTYLQLPAIIAPYKCSVLPLSNNQDFMPFVTKLSQSLTENDVSHKVDASSGSIGRRYARTDQIAVPYGITIDFDTIKTNTATLRERDSMKQVRASLDEMPDMVRSLSKGRLTWQEVLNNYPVFEQQDSTK